MRQPQPSPVIWEGTRLGTLKDVGQMTRFSASTIRRLVRAGRIPCIQLSGKRGHLRFPLDLVEQLLHQHADTVPPQEHIGQTSVTPDKRLPGRKPKWMNPSPCEE